MKFIADENIPYQVVEVLRQAGYEVSTVVETTYLGMRNDELATLSIQLQRAVLTRDADFTHGASFDEEDQGDLHKAKRRPQYYGDASLR